MIPKLEINYSCINCDNCRILCPENAILLTGGKYQIINSACSLCELCIIACPVGAISSKPISQDN